MFCPQCGTKTTMGHQRFCRECGAEIGADPAPGGQQAADASATTPPRRRPFMLPRVSEKDNAMKMLLLGAGLALLLPLAIPLVFGILLASLFAGVAVVATAIKLAPVVAVGIIVYWLVTRQKRTLPSGR